MTLACVYRSTRWFRCRCGTVCHPQEPRPRVMRAKPAGQWYRRCESQPPASSSSTRTEGSALSRLASTQPAEPAPVMM
ncbi:MAG: hypothetical protein GAK34_03564 [Delftia tsuruhatensis]|nr:MAG: hypothetical protein GAK34_03564 [Delftia tsuruhatensis]